MKSKNQFNSWSVLSRNSIQSNLSVEDVAIDISLYKSISVSSLSLSDESPTQVEGKQADLSSLMHIPSVAKLLANERKANEQLQKELMAAKRSAQMAMESKATKEDELARKVKVLQYKQKVANDQMMDMHAELSAFKKNSKETSPSTSPSSKWCKPIQATKQPLRWRRKATNDRFGKLVQERKPLANSRFNRFPSNESSPSRFPSSPKRQGRFPTSPRFCAPANPRTSPQSSKGELPHNSKGQPIIKRPQDLPFELAKKILMNSKGFGPCWGHFGIQSREAHSCYRPTFKNATGHLRCVYGSHVNLGGCWEVTK